MTADQLQTADFYAEVERIRALAQPAQEPVFAVSVAAKKWASLQAEGYKMQRLCFERDGVTGTIDTWGKVLWEPEPAELVWCGCGDGYPADSFEAGVMSAISKCSNCVAMAQPRQDPVAWPCQIEEADFEQDTVTLKMLTLDYTVSDGKHWLCTSPPQRQPLTKHEVHLALDRAGIKANGVTLEHELAVARATEAAHGIKERA